MTARRRAAAAAAIVLTLLAIAGCGQMGPLILPDANQSTEEEQGDEENE